MKIFLITSFFILLSLFLLEYKIVGQAVYGDGRYYWAFTRSLYFSQDIDISDEMGHLYSPEINNKDLFFGKVKAYEDKTRFVTGGFSLGMSLVWLPFFFFADALVVTLTSLGQHLIRNGYSDIYQIMVGIGNILFVVGGLGFLGDTLKRWYSMKIVITSLILLLFATNLLYYSGLDTINSHPFSFLLVSSLIWLFFQYEKTRDIRFFIGMGIVSGLLIGNRRQDAIFVLIPLAGILFHRIVPAVKRFAYLLKYLILLGVGVFLGYLPQLLLIIYGQGHLAFYAHTDQAFSFPTHFWEILFDPKLGVVLYMPITILAFIGLFLFKKKSLFISIVFIFIISLQFLLISSWEGWHEAAYTMRYFISGLPLLLFGIAEIIERLQKRFSFGFVVVCITMFVIHQLLMVLSFKLFLQDPTMVGTELSRSGQLKLQILQQMRNLIQR